MPPSIEPTLHSWSRDDLLDFAYRRGGRLRRQRLAVRSAAAAAALTAVLLPVGLMLASSDPAAPRRLQTVDNPSTTVPDQALQAEAATSSDSGPAGGGGPSSPAQPNARGVPPSAGKPAISPTVNRMPAQLPACGASEVSMRLQPVPAGQTSWGVAQRVDIDAFITNTSNHACARPDVARLDVYDAGNR